MFGFSDNNVQAGGDAADQATTTADNSLEHHSQGTQLTTPAPTADDNGYIMTDIVPPAVTSAPTSVASTTSVPVIHPAPQATDTDTQEVVPSDDLLNLKQSALQELSPLVDHLEQTPEEKFRTTMMLIQASDNQALLRDAFSAAKEISDEKARAQALLDIVNEINYFTQQTENSQ